MINVTISVDTSKFDRVTRDFQHRLAQAKKKALMDIGEAVRSRSMRAFRDVALRPSPWAPRKRPGDGHPLLIRSGDLRQSLDWRLAGDDAVVVGTSKEYAVYHQHGTKKMPARPFFPVDAQGRLVPAMERKISKLVGESLHDAFADMTT